MESHPTVRASLSHVERTAEEPRDERLHKVLLSRIFQVNRNIKVFWLTPIERQPRIQVREETQPWMHADSVPKFRPGQWLDVYVPGIAKAGGFTITSSPSSLSHATNPHLELAIQRSPENPPAAWFWSPANQILDTMLEVRVGGSFVWPPPLAVAEIKRAVFVAGGVGINPLVSMLSYLAEIHKLERDVRSKITLLYSTRDLGAANATEILFLRRLEQIFRDFGEGSELKLFLTSGDSPPRDRSEVDDGISYDGRAPISILRRRITENDLLDALGPVEERKATVCYICGIPNMTDAFVESAQNAEGMKKETVLFEKWW